MRVLVTVAALLAIGAPILAMAKPRPRPDLWTWDLPNHVPVPRVPADNPMSEAKFQLGRHLFYDKRLSGNGALACVSCHEQKRAFTDGRRASPGSTGELTDRNAPTLANVAWLATYNWANPALVTLERQVEVPLYGEHPVEMGVTDDNKQDILARLASEPKYRDLFADAYPEAERPISFDEITKALASFQRGITSFRSRYDRYLEGKVQLSEAEQNGLGLFFGERGECHHCHGSSNFNDQFMHAKTGEITPLFHNTGLYNLDGTGAYPAPNRGIFEVTGDAQDMGRFKAPSLRNVDVTAPYMHDGSIDTLEEVIGIYSDGGRKLADGPVAGDGAANPNKSDLIVRIDLSDEEKANLVAFLKALTDDELLTSSRFSDPWSGDGLPQP